MKTRKRRPRLSWFRFFVDDFLGGVTALSDTDTSHYLRALCAQWGSKARCAIPADPESLRLICRGEAPSARVLEKFDEVMIDGVKYLRNQKLCDEFMDSWKEYAAKRRGGKRSTKREDTVTESATDTATESVTESTPEPQPHSSRTTDSSHHPARARESPGSRLDRAEAATQLAVRQKQNQLGSLLVRLSEHSNSRLMVPAWCKKVSSHKKGAGVSDYRMLGSIDRLEKSIEDAVAWLSTLDGGKVVK